MDRFRNCIIDIGLNDKIKKADYLLQAGSVMIKEISDKDDFKYDSGLGVEVALRLIAAREKVNIYTYRPWRKSSKVIGYYNKGNVYFNLYKLPDLSLNDFVGTLLHEYAHHCGFHHNSAFGTSNYKTKDKVLYSVPYFLSENVEKWL
jgi:hypothetical protein